jgi:cell surface protein SprA
LWVNDFKPNSTLRGGLLRIDMGSIDEDFYDPTADKWNDEDNNGDGWTAVTEDTGLDLVYNDKECANPPCGDTDLNGDDFDSERDDGRYLKINGTEGNGLYDTEDLDGSNSLDEKNIYFSYIVDLADAAVVDIRRDYDYNGLVNEHERDSWRLYRINLNEYTPVSPTGEEPRFDQVKHIRIWFDDLDAVFYQEAGEKLTRRFQIANFKIVGNRWEEDGVRDLSDTLIPADSAIATSFGIGVINTKTNPVDYNPPIRPREENEVFEKEQSLFVKYDSLEAGTSIRIMKRFVGRGLNMTSYRDLNMWVHAETDSANSDLEYYFRLGTNDKFYYEIALPVTTRYFDKTTGWARIVIKLEELSALKFGTADSMGVVTSRTGDLVDVDRSYPIKMVQSPNLADVRFLYAGVRNKSTNGSMFSGQVWLNDIYLGDVKRDFGHAERINASINLGGGILSLSGAWNRTDADFRALRARRGSGILRQSYNFNARTALQHFVPLLGFAIPVNVSYNRSISQPKYIPNSDIEINEQSLADSLRTEVVTRSFSTSLSKKSSKNPILKYTIGKMSTNFSLSETVNRSPSSRDTTRSMAGTLGYNINWGSQRDLRIYKNYRIRYWINTLNFNVSATRRTTRRARFLQGKFTQDPFIFDAKLNSKGSINYQPFRSLSSTFNMSMARDVNLRHEVWGIDIGREVGRNHSLKATFKPPPLPIIKLLTPDFSYASGYSENSSPNLRRTGDPVGTRTVNNNRTSTVKMKLDMGKHFASIFERLGLLQEKPELNIPAAPTPRPGSNARADAGPGTPVVSAAVDTAAAITVAVDTLAADSTSTERRADPLIALRKLGNALKEIRRIDINVRQMVNSGYSKVPDRPNLAYQLAFSTEAGVGPEGQPDLKPDKVTKNLNITLKSGAQISKNIDVTAQYLTTFTNAVTAASETEARTVNWPDVSVSWKGLEGLGIFKSIFRTGSANLNYKKSSNESGRKDNIDNKRSSLAITPSLVFTFKNDINTNLTTAYTKNDNDVRGNKTESNTISVNLNFKKELKGGSGFKLPIPFFRKEVKWKSRLTTGLGISYMRTGGKRYVVGSEFFTPIAMTSSFGVSPNMMYSFSQALNGRFFIDYGRSFTEQTGQTTTTVRVGVSAVFTF